MMIQGKKGDFPSLIYAIIAIFIIGVLFLFSSHLTNKLYDEFDGYFNSSTKYNSSEAQTTIQKLDSVNSSRIWDYGFLAIFIGFIMALAFSSFSTRISPIFFWIYGILSIVGLILGTILSNSWQELATHPEFATTIANFPITNYILGSYFPIAVTALIAIIMIFLFGKNPAEDR